MSGGNLGFLKNKRAVAVADTDPLPVTVVSGSSGSTDTGSHEYGYTNGMLTTDTWTVGGVVKVKTFTYTNGQLTGESDWVTQ